ncbi:CGNR zinc finger domain-containing protein [Symbioplanes lichenis]|uniref:CGNR zinc finger domain-containing protein n=1 Tax=Symbioplanes lichenis TaxID=1629072 RepID=UPI0027396A35|nr:CGNR zinc finger domain-containing protein [Actinoplanes lichenis]
MRQPGDRAPAPAALALVQDLANTIDIEMARDTLRTAADLAAFAAAHDLPRLTFNEADLAPAVDLREALRDVCQSHTGVDVPDATLARLDALLAAAPLRLTLDATGTARPEPAPGLDGTPALTAHVARAILLATADGTWPRLKACSAHPCRWVYYDRSPAGRSRWCTMAICGSRAKMRTYRRRPQ